jgi:hypothetical protein
MFTRSDRASLAVLSLGGALLILADAYGNRFDPTLDASLLALGVGFFVSVAVILFAWNIATYRKK